MSRSRSRSPSSANRIGVLFALAGLVLLIGGYNYPRHWWPKEFVFEVYPNSGADLIGASIVILLVDRFTRQRDDQERRRQLVRECGSPDHAVANRALLELEARQWLIDGTLADAQLPGADLAQARLEAADLTGANLAGANLGSANLTRVKLTGASLGGTDLSYANLEWAQLSDTNLTQANLRRADAAGILLKHADLTQADLTGADLTQADLTGADLSGADLSGTNLTRADLTGTTLNSVRHDNLTRWPVEFRPPDGTRD
jgi:uncharacterized protein YjbI with pentapeptide repeats